MSVDPLAQLRSYAHELAGMAKTGLQFVHDDYERDRYTRMLRIAEELVGCTAAAFDGEGRLLLVRRSDNNRWSLPTGWPEINSSPAENALRELREETGFDGVVQRLLGVFDNRRFGSAHPYQIYNLLFRVRLTGGSPRTSVETTDLRLFPPDAIPNEVGPVQRAMIEVALAEPREAVFQ